MDNKERTNVFIALISYIAILFLVSSFIIIGIAIVYGVVKEVSVMQIIESFVVTDFTQITPEIARASAITQAYGNLITYVISTILVVIFLRRYLFEDAKTIKENPKKLLLFSFVAGIIFLVLSLIIDILISYLAPSSQNQQNIEMIMNNGGAIPMAIAVVFFAPLVEELIYRKCIFKIFENSGKTACYVASIIFFVLPHMLSTQTGDPLTWILQCIPYASCGFMLCYIYDKSNKNIYAPIIAHLMNNLLAAILIFI
jgi:membrane protease YdiL (CAAX protease family)